jgi:hypothetical protein
VKRELRVPMLCASIPPVVVGALLLLARPEPLTPLAPLLGPFAGELYGHRDCTLAHLAPEWSMAAAIALVLAALGSWRLHANRRALLRRASHALLACACMHWCLLAALSVGNTLS